MVRQPPRWAVKFTIEQSVGTATQATAVVSKHTALRPICSRFFFFTIVISFWIVFLRPGFRFPCSFPCWPSLFRFIGFKTFFSKIPIFLISLHMPCNWSRDWSSNKFRCLFTTVLLFYILHLVWLRNFESFRLMKRMIEAKVMKQTLHRIKLLNRKWVISKSWKRMKTVLSKKETSI